MKDISLVFKADIPQAVDHKMPAIQNYVEAVCGFIEIIEKTEDWLHNPVAGCDLVNAYRDYLEASYALGHVPFDPDPASDFQILADAQDLQYTVGRAMYIATLSEKMQKTKEGLHNLRHSGNRIARFLGHVFSDENLDRALEDALEPENILSELRYSFDGGLRQAMAYSEVRDALPGALVNRADGVVRRYGAFPSHMDVSDEERASVVRKEFRKKAKEGSQIFGFMMLLDMATFGFLAKKSIRDTKKSAMDLVHTRLRETYKNGAVPAVDNALLLRGQE